MTSRSSVAASVARSKEAHPEDFCPHARCLWRTGGGACPRHREGALRVRFTFLDGSGSVTGPVSGAGGFLSTIAQLDVAARLLANGRTHGLYAPEPGCVACFPDYSAAGNGAPYVVRLTDVRWEAVS